MLYKHWRGPASEGRSFSFLGVGLNWRLAIQTIAYFSPRRIAMNIAKLPELLNR
jgi:hypothetical protein